MLSRALNYELAGLVSFAFHDPENMPSLVQETQEQEIPDEVAQAQVRAFFHGLAER